MRVMIQFYVKALFFFIFFFSLKNSFGQSRILSNNASISIINCDSGNQLYSLFGHTAIRVKDTINHIDDVYNYGYFDFRTPNFYLKFVKGNLRYFVAIDKFENFYPEYVYEQRGVYEQVLNLSAIQKQRIFNELNSVITSENRFYTYKFIDRNCTTMIVDLINKNIDGKLSVDIKDADKTNRTILYGYLGNHFYENLGINIMFGLKTDEKFDHVFLPMQLVESIQISKNNGKALSNSINVINIHTAPRNTFSYWNNWYTYILFFLLLVLINKKSLILGYFAFTGCIGLFLFLAGLISLHQELSWNLNFLLFNPLLLALVYFVLKKDTRFVIVTTCFCVAMLLLFLVSIIFKTTFLMFLPMFIANAIFLTRLIIGYKKMKSTTI